VPDAVHVPVGVTRKVMRLFSTRNGLPSLAAVGTRYHSVVPERR
jgi:hypothetical protein